MVADNDAADADDDEDKALQSEQTEDADSAHIEANKTVEGDDDSEEEDEVIDFLNACFL